MKFVHRLAYYLGGFTIGIVILIFFLQGKKTSCDYGPNARTTKNMANKHKIYSEESLVQMHRFDMDTLVVSDLIRYGEVDFSKSDTKSKPCKTYYVINTFKKQAYELKVRNCDTLATIQEIIIRK